MKDLHKQFVFYGENARKWMRKCELLLPEIEKQKIWKKKGYGSIYEYAAKLAGMSRSKVDDCLWILSKIEDKPEIRKVAEEKGLGRVRPIVTLATSENEKFWAEKARKMGRDTLRVYTREFRARPKTQPEETAILMSLKPEIAQKIQKIKGDLSWNDLMEEFLELREEKLKKEKPKPVKTTSRHIPNKIKKHVLKKTGYKCVYPTCKKEAEVLHHTRRFALNKNHDPDTIVPLCKDHHKIAHLGLMEENTWQIHKHPDTADPRYKIDQLVMEYG